MDNDRIKRRHRKRISLKFGIGELEKIGFTDDLNHEGLFIRTSVVARVGTTILVQIQHPKGDVLLTGEVRWAKRIPSNVLHKLKGGMGIKIVNITSNAELYHALCDELIEQRGA